jgi:hypothetical protein
MGIARGIEIEGVDAIGHVKVTGCIVIESINTGRCVIVATGVAVERFIAACRVRGAIGAAVKSAIANGGVESAGRI